MQPIVKLRSAKVLRVTIGRGALSVRLTKPTELAKANRQQARDEAGDPAPRRRFLEGYFQRRKPNRQQDQRQHIEFAGLAEPHRLLWQQDASEHRRNNPRRNIDQEQPVPGIGLGNPTADDWPNGRRKHRQHAGECGCNALSD